MNNCFIILAAGKSKRFKSRTPKAFTHYKGDILINHSVNKAILSKKFSKIVVVINKSHNKFVNRLKKSNLLIIYGGKTRAQSAKKSLEFIKKFNPKNVFIHDAARPDFSVNLINNLFKSLKKYDGVIPVLRTNNSVKFVDKNQLLNLDRKKVFFSQTPQAFKYNIILKLQGKINNQTTDDASLLINAKKKIKFIKGENNNIKITDKNDVKFNKIFYGIGFDVHRLVPYRKLYLGGIIINSKIGTLGHSDGDPVLHAITDAILGACRMGDIGNMFSDKSRKYKNIRSTILLNKVIKDINKKKFIINNLDLNIITQHPKISKYKLAMIKSISKLCNLHKNQINIKGKTTEKLGIIGKEKAIACEAIVCLQQNG